MTKLFAALYILLSSTVGSNAATGQHFLFIEQKKIRDKLVIGYDPSSNGTSVILGQSIVCAWTRGRCDRKTTITVAPRYQQGLNPTRVQL